mgnify:CR=1 FL=1
MQTFRSLWLFIQDQILGMKWLNALIGDLLSLLGLDTASRLGGSVQFFVYDVVKITVLLCFLIFMISYIQSYFPPERSRRILGRFRGIGANIASAFGKLDRFPFGQFRGFDVHAAGTADKFLHIRLHAQLLDQGPVSPCTPTFLAPSR